MAYSASENLLLGDLQVSSKLNKDTYVNDAAEEIDGRIGYLYQVPLDQNVLGAVSKLVLKKINNLIASGRIIMSIAAGQEGSALHAYGESLLKEGWAELGLILTGQLPLPGAVKLVGADDGRAGASIQNHDKVSAFDAFEMAFYGPNNWTWRPDGYSARWAPGPDVIVWP